MTCMLSRWFLYSPILLHYSKCFISMLALLVNLGELQTAHLAASIARWSKCTNHVVQLLCRLLLLVQWLVCQPVAEKSKAIPYKRVYCSHYLCFLYFLNY